ncbi:exosortase [Catenovulum sp. 2E275]|uniref:exosortase A n=1 Tax=Catenovulum sp. 2E275 TaxID=2980497 RepID=UPI0021D12D01|nr:exosortase A [Catenovulum sp. 2E275]MCU4675537.1 exosortase [Catenovulum sp. 2E275]
MKTISLNIWKYLTFITLGLWIILFWEGLYSALDIWLRSEIYNHCLLILPICIYLAYQKRKQINLTTIKPLTGLIIPIVAILFVYLFALIGEIQVLAHIATFTSITFICFYLLGYQEAKKISFPLFFVWFSIPIGDQLIPVLQQMTATASVALLQASHIPVFKDGLYIEIPNGKFLVAEACSGISFFISASAFTFLYSHLYISHTPKKILFTIIGVTTPIIANMVRVYGIIMVAHLSDMEYATGADHLIYGWVFYLFVLWLVYLIGEKFKDSITIESTHISNKAKSSSSADFKVIITSNFILILSLLVAIYIKLTVEDQTIENSNFAVSFSQTHDLKISNQNLLDTYFTDPDNITNYVTTIKSFPVAIQLINYSENNRKGEPISSINKFYDNKVWNITTKLNLQKNHSNLPEDANILELSGPNNHKRVLITWYQFEDYKTGNPVKAKLYHTLQKLLGSQYATGIVAISINAAKKDIDLALETALNEKLNNAVMLK